jgi:AcrR family transcriptional regulator
VEGFADLHAVINDARGSDARSRLMRGCLAYRAFAVEHPNRYELMFRQMKELELSPEALEQAERTFAQLVGRVEDAQTAGVLRDDDPVEVAQLIWNALHGGVSLESIGVSFSGDPEANFAAMIEALLVGLAAR